MRRMTPTQLLIGGAAALGALAAARTATSAIQHRRQLAHGEIRPVQSLWTYIDGLRIHAHAALPIHTPDPLPVVLVHGFGVSSSYFLPTVERLATQFNVYAPDLPGHGKSDKPLEPLDVPRFADALIAWMDSLGIECASLVGNSMGCQIVVDAAMRYPARVERLVLIGPTADPQTRPLPELFKRFLIGSIYERPSLSWVIMKDYGTMAQRLAPELKFMREDRIETKLPQLTVPTMLVRGEKDMISSQRWLDELARLIGTDRITVIPGMGHAVNYSAAEQLVAAITPFLATPSSKAVS